MTTTTLSRHNEISDEPGSRSFWTRIANEISEAIARGVYAPGERLPSEHALAEQYGVNRHTVRRSLADLCQRGLVRATRGSGTYVEEFAVDLVLGKRTRNRQNLMQSGMRGGFQVISAEAIKASADVAKALGVQTGSQVMHLWLLGQGDGLALHVSERYFPLPRFRGLPERIEATGSITEAFAALGIKDYTRRESRVSARMPDAGVAEALKQPINRPTLLVTSVNVDPQDVAIEYARTWFAGDRVTLTVEHDES